ncbi:MAG: hypothetical protein GX434_15715 [Peptococcaceae bacterium]|nr:hypothetical protein [Peptococcaceae bacterium]
MEKIILNKNDLNTLFARLKDEYEVYGPVAKKDQYVFSMVENVEELKLDYDTTILPPKKYFHSPVQSMIQFSEISEGDQERSPLVKRALFGVHPCDVHATLSLDKVFLETYPDPYYKDLRKQTLIVALNCKKPCRNGFCASFNTGPGIDIGFDLCMTDLGDRYMISVGSEKGRDLVSGFLPAGEEEIRREKDIIDDCRDMVTRWIDTEEDLGEFLHQNFEHKVWRDVSKECLACGGCTTVCPTCYCFAVKDVVDLTIKDGKRMRFWDSCMFYEFSRVALDHVFMPEREARVKQRLYHKLAYYQQQFNVLGCVGCGRCVTACVKNIDPVMIMARIQADPCEEKEISLYKPPHKKIESDENPWMPYKAVIKDIKKQTCDVNTYTFEYLDEKIKAGYTYLNGTYNLISLFGTGESAISISSWEEMKGTFEHTVRAVGNVTKALAELKVGDVVGIRGPYGHGWPMEKMKGRNILLIAGGIGLAPLRGVVESVKNHREEYGKFEILYGARTPGGLLFTDEYEKWRQIPDTNLYLTVDEVPQGMEWNENVGVVTTLFDRISCSRENTVVITCGPDIMMKFAVLGLMKQGWSPEQIYVSLERRMGCGMKKCGNCQMGPVFVCQDGPVFQYAEIMNLPGGVF